MELDDLRESVYDKFINCNDGKYLNAVIQNNIQIWGGGSFWGKDNRWHKVDIGFQKIEQNKMTYPTVCINVVNIDDIKTLIADKVDPIVSSCSYQMLGCGCEEWILTNGSQYIFISDIISSSNIQIYSLESTWKRIVKLTTNDTPFSYSGIWDFILDNLSKMANDQSYFHMIDLLKKLKFKDEDFIYTNNTFSLKSDMEFELMKKILFKDDSIQTKGKICRYISISALKRILIDGVFSMSGLAGMNDSSEIDVLRALETPGYTNKEVLPLPHIIAENNSYFINSFCRDKKEDDLTMWRLYGDDGKGVCLTFDYSLNNVSSDKGLYIFPVIYYSEIPIELTKLLDLLDKGIYVCNRSFSVSNINLWKHFLKPKEFEDESEVRLLLHYSKYNDSHTIGNVSWILNSNDQIFHPIFNFLSKNVYPLKLTKVILGPKFPQREVNFNQISYLIHNLNSNIIITKSRCRHYR